MFNIYEESPLPKKNAFTTEDFLDLCGRRDAWRARQRMRAARILALGFGLGLVVTSVILGLTLLPHIGRLV